MIGRPPSGNLTQEQKMKLQEKYDLIISRVRQVLEDEEAVSEILKEYPKEIEEFREDADRERRKRINAVLDMAGLVTIEDKKMYEEALCFSLSGYTVVYARDIDELMVNPYNQEITLAWGGNTDFQFCFDLFLSRNL